MAPPPRGTAGRRAPGGRALLLALTAAALACFAHAQEAATESGAPAEQLPAADASLVTAAGTVPIAPSIAAVQCNNGLTTSCSLFNATPDSTPAVIGFGYWVLSALAMQGWVFYYSTVTMRYPTRPTGPTYVSALVRCRAQDTGSCATYNAFNDVQISQIAPMAALTGDRFFFTPVKGQLYRCDIDAPSGSRCAAWMQAGADYYSLTMWGDTLWAGMANGHLQSCPGRQPSACTDYDFGWGSPVRAITHDNQSLWAGLDNGNQMKCTFVGGKPSCSIWARILNVGKTKAMTAMTDGRIYAGFDSGKIYKINVDRQDSYDYWNTVSNLNAFFVSPATNNSIIVGRYGDLMICSIYGADNCLALATGKPYAANSYPSPVQFPSITGEGAYLYTSPVAAPGFTARAYLNWYLWLQLNACIDNTVVKIISADPIEGTVAGDTVDGTGMGKGTASVYASSANYGLTNTQTPSVAASIARQVSVALTFSNAVQQAWKLELKIKTPLIDEVIVGYSGSVTVTEGKTTTVSDTTTSTITIPIQTPPRNNCTASGTLNTVSQTWRQNFKVNVVYACGATGEEIWEGRVVVGDLVGTSSQVKVEYQTCTPIPLVINNTCGTNPGCNNIFPDTPDRACCPLANGTYLKCCAVAQAVTPPCQQDVDYLESSQFICPNTNAVWSKCCPPVTRVLPGSSAPTQALADATFQGPTVLGSGSWANASSGASTTRACPPGFQENSAKRTAGGGYLLCMRKVAWPAPPSVKVVTDVAVVTGSAKKGWNALKCARGYTMVPFLGAAAGDEPDDGVPRVPASATTLAAVCLKTEAAKAGKGSKPQPVTGLRVVASRAECAALGKAWKLVYSNIAAAWPRAQSFLCMSK